MVRIVTNIKQVGEVIQEKLDKLNNPEYLFRPVMFGLIDLMTQRIHIDGNDASDSQIGTYSSRYMAVRTGNYKNADKFKKGKQKGQNKNSGTFTDATIRLDKKTGVFSGEDKVGTARPNYNRSSDTKVVISLTRQLENSWTVEPTPKGYGIGFLNQHNFDKSQWVEDTYKKKIFALTEGEQTYALEYINDLINEALQ